MSFGTITSVWELFWFLHHTNWRFFQFYEKYTADMKPIPA